MGSERHKVITTKSRRKRCAVTFAKIRRKRAINVPTCRFDRSTGNREISSGFGGPVKRG